MQADQAWRSLGELLTRELERASDDVRQRFVDQITFRLQYFKTTKAQRDAVEKATRGTFDASEAVLSCAGDSLDLVVRKQLRQLWEHVDGEYEPEERWRELGRVIRETLQGVHDEGDKLIAALGDVGTRTADRHLWNWPLSSRERLRDVLGDWRTGIAERMSLPVDKFLDPASVDDRPVYRMNEFGILLSNLAVWLEERTAWARALYDLEPVIAAMVPK